MTLQDLECIKDILLSEFDDFWNYNILKTELLNQSSVYFVAKDINNTITGFAGIQIVLDEADITNIVTRKFFRSHGIGTLLLEKLIITAKEKNMRCITLEVNENNVFAIKLYNKFGFRSIGLRKKYYNGTDNAIIMKLDLN